MSPSPKRPQASPPLLAIFLLLASLGCGAVSAWLGQADVPSLVIQKITRANGLVSAETSAWLKQTPFQVYTLCTGAALLVLGGIAYVQHPRMQRFVAKIAPPEDELPATPSARSFLPHWKFVLMACVTVFIYYFPTLGSGYFRYDDFDFLFFAQSGPFWETVWQPHGDHFLPVTRVLALLGLKFFGVTAWPYNLWLLLCMCGVLVAGTSLLSELKASRPAQIIFLCLVVFWSPWAELMSGYYILSIFLLITMLGLAAICFYLRWLKQGGSGYAPAMAGCVLIAPLIDISGCLVIAAAGVFLGLNLASRLRTAGLRPWLDQHKALLGWLAFAAAISLACIAYDYAVLHRGVFLSMGGEDQRSLAQLMGDVGYAFSAGLLVSMATPFIYARLPVGILGGLVAVVLLLWIVFSWGAVRSAGKVRRWTMAAIMLVVLGTCLMVCLGRHNADTMVVRWAAKHVGPAYVWLCVFVALGWDSFWRTIAERQRTFFAELTLIILGLFVVVQNAFGLIGMAVAFPPFGYPAEIRDAGRRRAAVERLHMELIAQVPRDPRGPTIIPTLDGNYINASCPSLFNYNLSRYQPFFNDDFSAHIKLVRNSVMQPYPGDGVQAVPVLRDAVSPLFIKLLRENSPLRLFFAAEVSLVTHTRHEPASDQDADIAVDSNGTTEVLLKAMPWDPETASRLRLAGQSLGDGPAQDIPVTVVFWSDCLNAEWRGTLLLCPSPDNIIEVDLRQAYAFSLSNRVANLRLVLTKPGRYRFRLAEVVP